MYGTRMLSHDREGIRIPLNEYLARLDLLTVLYSEMRPVDNSVAFTVTTLGILDNQSATSVHHHKRPRSRLNNLQFFKPHSAGMLCFER